MSSEEVETIIGYANLCARHINAKIMKYLNRGCNTRDNKDVADNVRTENGVVTHVRLMARLLHKGFKCESNMIVTFFVHLGCSDDPTLRDVYHDLGWVKIKRGKVTKHDIIAELYPLIKSREADDKIDAYTSALLATA